MAMLAKTLWNLAQNPTSIAYRLLKAKYFRRGEILTANLGYKPSFLWRSLVAAQELIREGMAWRVGNGRDILISEHRWIGVDNPSTPISVIPEEYKEQHVDTLINSDTGQWKRDLINQLFNSSDAARILAIPLSSRSPKDRCIWRFTKYGQFSVKSAYHTAVEKLSKAETRRASTSMIHSGWKKLWKINTIPRVKIFLWKVCANSLPTRQNLMRRGCCEDAICGLCGEEEESIDHLLLRCPSSRSVWYGSPLRLDTQGLPFSTFREVLWSRFEICPPDYLSIMAYLAWEIWNFRNRKYFEGKTFSFTDVINKVQSDWSGNETQEAVPRRGLVQQINESRWKKPELGKMKLNSDVAVWPDGRTGMGFVLRDHTGGVVLAGKSECLAAGSTALLEGLALRYALQLTKQYHFKANLVECDSKILVDCVNGITGPEPYCEIIAGDIRDLLVEVKGESIVHIPRQANQAAHKLAHGPDLLSLRHTPKQIVSLIANDVID